jgi:RNA polymerase sigma-70 factor (ECF subfamily)
MDEFMKFDELPGSFPGGDVEQARQAEEFVRLFAANHYRLFAYIMALMHDRTDAEEVFQEASLVLWREFARFRPGADFMPWACAIALNQMRKFWRQRRRDKHTFSVALLEDLASQAIEMQSEFDARRQALADCLKRLPVVDRSVVELYYGAKRTADEVAEKLGKSTHAIYKALTRARQRLYECIGRKLAAES